MKLAAVDIGSNAIRLQIDKVITQDEMVSFKKLEFVRYPMQLGRDVFKNETIGQKTLEKFFLLMRAYRDLMDLYDIDAYRAVATSAMREAKNGKEITHHIREQLEVDIEVISGQEEARILNKAIIPYLSANGIYIHIDVGGGSTELNVFSGKKHVASKSFQLGSLRKLSNSDRKNVNKQMKEWIKKSKYLKNKNVTSIGTGGNINRIYKIANKSKGAELPFTELKALKAYINEFSISDREQILKLNPDRAEVIIPAAKIYINIMSLVQSDHMIVPRVGLKDGMLYELYEKTQGKKIKDIEFVG